MRLAAPVGAHARGLPADIERTQNAPFLLDEKLPFYRHAMRGRTKGLIANEEF